LFWQLRILTCRLSLQSNVLGGRFGALTLVGSTVSWIAAGVAAVTAAALEFWWKWVDRRFPA
jgi:hypothetical protein